MRKVAVTASTSGNGKTTLGQELARRLDVPFVELDALVHGPNGTETSDEELRRLLGPVLAGDGWVIDGGYPVVRLRTPAEVERFLNGAGVAP